MKSIAKRRNSTSRQAVRNAALMVIVLTGALNVVSPAAASCVRHFYNKSNTQWEVRIYKKNGALDVRIYVGAKKTRKWKWTNSLWHAKQGGFYKYVEFYRNGVKQCKGATKRSKYSCGYYISAQSDGDCIYIKHRGSTGKVSVNAPANGDLVLR